MKTFDGSICLLLTSFLIIFVNADGITDHKELREKCRNEMNLTPDDIKLSTTIPNTLGCYIYCFLKDLNVMDEKGTFDPTSAINAVDDALRDGSTPEILACYDINKESFDGDGCKTAFQMTHCFKERAQNLYELLGIFEPAI